MICHLGSDWTERLRNDPDAIGAALAAIDTFRKECAASTHTKVTSARPLSIVGDTITAQLATQIIKHLNEVKNNTSSVHDCTVTDVHKHSTLIDLARDALGDGKELDTLMVTGEIWSFSMPAPAKTTLASQHASVQLLTHGSKLLASAFILDCQPDGLGASAAMLESGAANRYWTVSMSAGDLLYIPGGNICCESVLEPTVSLRLMYPLRSAAVDKNILQLAKLIPPSAAFML